MLHIAFGGCSFRADGERLTGMVFFHRGNESEIELTPASENKTKPRKRK